MVRPIGVTQIDAQRNVRRIRTAHGMSAIRTSWPILGGFDATTRKRLCAFAIADSTRCTPSAAQPTERALCARGDRAVGVDHGRSCRRLCGDVDAARRGHASMLTTRPCRCWRRVRRGRDGCGPMCATISPSAGALRISSGTFGLPPRGPRSPAPIRSEPGTMPSNDGLRPDNRQGISLEIRQSSLICREESNDFVFIGTRPQIGLSKTACIRKQSVDANEYHPVECVEMKPLRRGAPEDDDLLPKDQVFGFKARP